MVLNLLEGTREPATSARTGSLRVPANAVKFLPEYNRPGLSPKGRDH
jgi:hypothetical protein